MGSLLPPMQRLMIKPPPMLKPNQKLMLKPNQKLMLKPMPMLKPNQKLMLKPPLMLKHPPMLNQQKLLLLKPLLKRMQQRLRLPSLLKRRKLRLPLVFLEVQSPESLSESLLLLELVSFSDARRRTKLKEEKRISTPDSLTKKSHEIKINEATSLR